MEPESVKRVREYLAAIERGETGESLSRFVHPDAVFEQLPNRIYPNGSRTDARGALEASRRGKDLLRRQRYEVRSVMADGDRVAMEVDWRGELAIPMGKLQPGAELHAQFGMFIELRDGRIVSQRNYDCYDPF
ncbi:MAG TPA: nuclear transport factor 2 family protein [Myxococcaceae bacterium]|jgi:ketosteroid isomerase-like protein